ncbi:hypothetical protein CRG98_008002 [Punica granatum]|uniref:Uncharacterized protein n=1 Tax=Punica granatum TaxID=22663 RepID=A0A2I0KSZ4_PUNGR|nr:hypothetical protein CRG98_008002 [Punica granatum]
MNLVSRLSTLAAAVCLSLSLDPFVVVAPSLPLPCIPFRRPSLPLKLAVWPWLVSVSHSVTLSRVSAIGPMGCGCRCPASAAALGRDKNWVFVLFTKLLLPLHHPSRHCRPSPPPSLPSDLHPNHQTRHLMAGLGTAMPDPASPWPNLAAKVEFRRLVREIEVLLPPLPFRGAIVARLMKKLEKIENLVARGSADDRDLQIRCTPAVASVHLLR